MSTTALGSSEPELEFLAPGRGAELVLLERLSADDIHARVDVVDVLRARV